MLGQARSTQRHEPRVKDDEPILVARIVALAGEYGRYGYRRITAMHRAEGWRVNHKRVERIWRQEGLKVPTKQPKRSRLWLNDGSCVRRRAEHPNHVWSYDFVMDRTHDGRVIRMLTIVDEYTRECSDVVHRAGQSVGERMHRVVQRQAARRAPGWRDLLHADRSTGAHRTVAQRIQLEAAAQFAWLSSASTGGYRGCCLKGRLNHAEWSSRSGTITGGRSLRAFHLDLSQAYVQWAWVSSFGVLTGPFLQLPDSGER